ncbi:glycoside hydrolase family 57, partial [Kordiimonas sp.]|uniref:glycoside hydrolase family 57 n=1 Tax=Kordiimonas sp. TaxID=1970157 RepID=UPI003A8DC905
MSGTLSYTAFHLNLAFSSVEEADHALIVERCYWPLLRLAQAGYPIGIEATSYTLQATERCDPSWISTLRELITDGKVELIASGLVQMIAPLVPPEMTEWNLKLGLEDYERMLGVRPTVALINEQAYSPGILPLYKAAGFKAIMMDWAEPASHHPEWGRKKYHVPQRLIGSGDCVLPVIWSDAISFQKFQRYAHGEIDAEEYFEFLSLQIENGVKALPVYTSDAEVFDYRPGRFTSEAAAAGAGVEAERIRLLFQALTSSGAVKLALPSAALALLDEAEEPIRLESAAAPVPVKKQRKYNVLRWAVTGRDDLGLNTYCWRQFTILQLSGDKNADKWRNLCSIWASDFRTHITEKRWKSLAYSLDPACTPVQHLGNVSASLPHSISHTRDNRFLSLETDTSHLVLNLYRGMAIHSFGFGRAQPYVAGAPAPNGLIGTMAHGFYEDIAYGADFYSGHLVAEPLNAHKVTDLQRCDPTVAWDEAAGAVVICAGVGTSMGQVQKELRFWPHKARLEVTYKGLSEKPMPGPKRLAHVTLNPRAFDRKKLYFESHNGGHEAERHSLWKHGPVPVDHGKPVSRLVSATTGLGMTGGTLEIGDDKHAVRLTMKRTDAAGAGLIQCEAVGD